MVLSSHCLAQEPTQQARWAIKAQCQQIKGNSIPLHTTNSFQTELL